MGFWAIYFPVLAAIVSGLALWEGFHFYLGYLFAKRQERHMQELEKKLQASGIDPSSYFCLDTVDMSGFDPKKCEFPTNSGSPPAQTGQYL